MEAGTLMWLMIFFVSAMTMAGCLLVLAPTQQNRNRAQFVGWSARKLTKISFLALAVSTIALFFS